MVNSASAGLGRVTPHRSHTGRATGQYSTIHRYHCNDVFLCTGDKVCCHGPGRRCCSAGCVPTLHRFLCQLGSPKKLAILGAMACALSVLACFGIRGDRPTARPQGARAVCNPSAARAPPPATGALIYILHRPLTPDELPRDGRRQPPPPARAPGDTRPRRGAPGRSRPGRGAAGPTGRRS